MIRTQARHSFCVCRNSLFRRNWAEALAVLIAMGVGLGGIPQVSMAEDEPTPVPDDSFELPPARNSQGGGARSGPGIESLLQLPSGFTGRAQATQVAGASEAEWKRRFRESNQSLSEARATLQKTKVALDGASAAGGANQWSIAPPGGGGGSDGANSGSPVNFKLRQALRQNRLDLEEADKQLKELVIEANLAGVPKTWRGDPQSGGDQPPPEVGQLLD